MCRFVLRGRGGCVSFGGCAYARIAYVCDPVWAPLAGLQVLQVPVRAITPSAADHPEEEPWRPLPTRRHPHVGTYLHT